MTMEQRLQGRIAIVTGAGQGIGRAVAKRLAAEGAVIAIAEFNASNAAAVAKEIVNDGCKAVAYSVDISDAGAVQSMLAQTVEQHGRVDILVNNAGVVQTKPMLDLSEEDWDRVLDINLRGTFFLLQAVARQMIRQVPESLRNAALVPADVAQVRVAETQEMEATDLAPSYGKVVNLASVAGRRGRPLSAHYAASKAAIINLTQSAALALAPYRINVNAVCPGIVTTPMWDQIDKDRGELFGAKPGEAMAAFVKSVPLKRPATPEDVAAAIAFFCSPDADYITGQALNVDGGFEMD
jgi:NAD(P)-dependent dehydrogenase (short-subunit alcohol dehydrogenase family)